MKTCHFFYVMLAVTIFSTVAGPLSAEGRNKNLDFIVIIDKSLSMEKHIKAVKSYVNGQIFDKLIKGDSVTIIDFYGQAAVIESCKIHSNLDIANLRRVVDKIRANGRWTDIGNALDYAHQWSVEHLKDSLDHYYLLLTDGKQEAPPGSRYPSPNLKNLHPYLVYAMITAHSGWKVIIPDVDHDMVIHQIAGEIAKSLELLPGVATN